VGSCQASEWPIRVDEVPDVVLVERPGSAPAPFADTLAGLRR
jgi:hypothetical protein